MIYFTLHKRFVKNKIHQFVDLCSICNVSRKVFNCPTTASAFQCFACVNVVNFSIDFSAAVLSPVLWLLHPRTFCTRTCGYKHGGIKQQFEKRSCTYSNSFCALAVVAQIPGSGSVVTCLLMLFSIRRNLCVVSGASFTTVTCRRFRCLLPGTFGHSMKRYEI